MVALWAGFVALIVLLLVLDLGLFHRRPHAVGVREALAWTAFWVAVALAFSTFVYWAYESHWRGLDLADEEPDGWPAAVLFFTGYVIEKSLSVDNLFVIALIFAYFGVPPIRQHRVLYWGILGALVMRGAMVAAGAALIQRFHVVLYFFGAFLIVTSVRLLFAPPDADPSQSRVLRLIRRFVPMTPDFVRGRYAVQQDGRWMLTPLGVALIAVEATDVVFAVDSIPAIFAVTADPFLVFTSNVFAILGLRSLYFALAGVMDKFHYLRTSLALILALVGLKMLLRDWLHTVPGITYYTLGVVALVLAAGLVASVWRSRHIRAPVRSRPLDARRSEDAYHRDPEIPPGAG